MNSPFSAYSEHIRSTTSPQLKPTCLVATTSRRAAAELAIWRLTPDGIRYIILIDFLTEPSRFLAAMAVGSISSKKSVALLAGLLLNGTQEAAQLQPYQHPNVMTISLDHHRRCARLVHQIKQRQPSPQHHAYGRLPRLRPRIKRRKRLPPGPGKTPRE